MHRYLVVVERYGNKYTAFAPDLPGCVATGRTRDEAQRNIQESIEAHLQGLREDDLPIPEPSSTAEFVTVR